MRTNFRNVTASALAAIGLAGGGILTDHSVRATSHPIEEQTSFLAKQCGELMRGAIPHATTIIMAKASSSSDQGECIELGLVWDPDKGVSDATQCFNTANEASGSNLVGFRYGANGEPECFAIDPKTPPHLQPIGMG